MKKVLLSILPFLTASNIIIAQNVNIPDANFKAYLLSETNINTNADNEIQVSEAQAFTGSIYAGSLNISSLTGIEAFPNIIELYCHSNQLTSLDVSNNMMLTGLFCGQNAFTTLDVSNHPYLTTLFCGTGGTGVITSINTTGCTSLTDFRCQFNQISSLDVSTNTNLSYLDFSGNLMASANLANGNNTAFTNINAYSNPNLTCVQVDDASYSNMNWGAGNFQFQSGATFSETPCPTPPNAPSNLSLTLVGNVIEIEWQDNSNDEDGFEVYAPASLGDVGGTWNQEYSLGANITAVNANPAWQGNYCYKVRSYKGNLKSDFTEHECVMYGTSGINENENTLLSIYPNPSSSTISLTIDSEQEISIFDLYGKQVLNTLAKPNQTIDVSGLANGQYVIKLNSGISQRLIKL